MSSGTGEICAAASAGGTGTSFQPCGLIRVFSHRRATNRLARPGDDHVEVVDLAVAQRGQAAGTPVAAEVEGEHAGHPVEPVGDPPDAGPLPRQRETVRDHDREVPRTGQVYGVDRDAVLGDQGRCRDDRLGHALTPTVRLGRGPAGFSQQ